ncbi:hypothetical protein E4U52_003410 [Claviceps spartinae]|nr:hypothetical protein E4U52_003410 [Claviceps spartinae]
MPTCITSVMNPEPAPNPNTMIANVCSACRRRRVSQGLPVATPFDCVETTIFCVAQVSSHVQSMRIDNNRHECTYHASVVQESGVVNRDDEQ